MKKRIFEHSIYERGLWLEESTKQENYCFGKSLLSLKSDAPVRIPIPIEVSEFIFKNAEQLLIKKLSPDFLAYICNKVLAGHYSFLLKNKSNNKFFKGTSLNSRKLRALYPNYDEHINLLVDKGYVRRSVNYSNQKAVGHSRLYELIPSPKKSNTVYVPYLITESKIVEELKRKRLNERIWHLVNHDTLQTNYSKNVSFIQHLRLKKEIIPEMNSVRYHYEMYLLNQISNSTSKQEVEILLNCSYGEKHHRLYDSFKNVQRGNKEILEYRDKAGNVIPVIDLDIPNSHAIFNLLYLISELKAEVDERRKNVANGKTNRYLMKDYAIVLGMKSEVAKADERIGNLDWISIANSSSTPHYWTCEINYSALVEELKTQLISAFQGKFYELFIDENCSKVRGVSYLRNRDESKEAFRLMLNGNLKNVTYRHYWKLHFELFPELTKLFYGTRLKRMISDGDSKQYGYSIARMESKIRLSIIDRVHRTTSFFDMHDGFLVAGEKGIENIQKAYKNSMSKEYNTLYKFLLSNDKATLRSLTGFEMKIKARF